MLRPKEVCQRLGISYAMLREYVKKGYIKPVILETGKWRFREEDVEKLMGIVRKRKVILYARVSVLEIMKTTLMLLIVNLSGKKSLTLSTFPQIRDVRAN